MTRVLVVEDNITTAAEIGAALTDHGFQVAHAATGQAGLQQAQAGQFEVIVLDRMLSDGMDGLSVLTALRGSGVDTPVLILSALSTLDERVRGLRAGGDDYLTKPFDFVELTARLDVLTRRRTRSSDERELKLQVGPLDVDLLSRSVRRGERLIELLPREYDLLLYLMRHAGQTVTRTMMFEAVWDYHYDERTNVIEVHIGRLRRKLDVAPEPDMIHTVRGAGYVLRAPA